MIRPRAMRTEFTKNETSTEKSVIPTFFLKGKTMSNLSEFCQSKRFEDEVSKLSEQMKKVVRRGSSDIQYRTKYNKRSDVKSIRSSYMKDRNQRIRQEQKKFQELMRNPKVRNLLKKEGITK